MLDSDLILILDNMAKSDCYKFENALNKEYKDIIIPVEEHVCYLAARRIEWLIKENKPKFNGAFNSD